MSREKKDCNIINDRNLSDEYSTLFCIPVVDGQCFQFRRNSIYHLPNRHQGNLFQKIPYMSKNELVAMAEDMIDQLYPLQLVQLRGKIRIGNGNSLLLFFCATVKINRLLCRWREYLQIKATPVLKQMQVCKPQIKKHRRSKNGQ